MLLLSVANHALKILECTEHMMNTLIVIVGCKWLFAASDALNEASTSLLAIVQLHQPGINRLWKRQGCAVTKAAASS